MSIGMRLVLETEVLGLLCSLCSALVAFWEREWAALVLKV